MLHAFHHGILRAAQKLGLLCFLPGAVGLCAGGELVDQRAPDGFLLRSWDQDRGLPSSRVNAVARTTDGYVWVATGGGLARFDGVQFTSFDSVNTPALRDSRVMCLLVDRAGTLWAGTANGTLVRREGDGFVRVDLRGERATRGRSVNSLAQDTAGDLWLATDGAGLIRLHAGQVEVFSATNGLLSDVVSQIVCDSDGRLWAIAGGKLFMREDGKWQVPPSPIPMDQPVRCITSAREGGLWVATLAPHPLGGRGGRVLRLKDGRWEDTLSPYPWPQDSQRARVQAMLEDSERRLWCTTAGCGIFLHTPGAGWQPVGRETPLAHVEALCLSPDESGVVWIGTRTLGLHQARPRPVLCLSPPPRDEPSVFLCVCARRDGSVWGGTDGAGVYCWQNGTRTHYGMEAGLGSLQANVLLEDQHATLWAGTFAGVFRFRGTRFEPLPGPPALRELTTALLEDRQGNLWAGTRGGLVRVSETNTLVFGRREGLEGLPPRALAEDAQGRIWAAVPFVGLFYQDGERFQRVDTSRLPGAASIRAMHFDDANALWIATQGLGLFRFKDDAFLRWTSREDGLPSDHHMALLEDGNGNLWLGSENGIFGLSKAALLAHSRAPNRRLTSWRITPEEGLAHKVCSGIGSPGASRATDGRLWFPDGPAIAAFYPTNVPRGVKAWPPIIEGVVVDGVRLASSTTGEHAIRSGAVTFEFHYTSPNIQSPDQIQYRYRLEGLDQDWVDAGTRRVAYYNRLTPGRYVFKVMAGSPERTWREAAQPLPFEVVPRIYERRTVQILAGAVLVGAVAVAVWRVERTRSRRRLERLHLQRAMDQERHRIARDIHDDLGSGLTEIILLSDTLRDETAALPVSEKTATEISTRARSLTRAMDEVVWALNPRNDSLESLLTYLNKFAQEYLTRAGVRCRWDVPLELPPTPLSAETRHHLYLACKETLNNVVKHAGASEVWVRLEMGNGRFTLSIEDNGRGFDNTRTGERGNGLLNLRKRLEELGGSCVIESTLGSGTQIRFIVSPALQEAPHPPPAS